MLKDTVNYDSLPENMRDSMERYINDHIQPGHFLTAALSNELLETFMRADSINLYQINALVDWLYNECPHNCWGSPEKVRAWLNAS